MRHTTFLLLLLIFGCREDQNTEQTRKRGHHHEPIFEENIYTVNFVVPICRSKALFKIEDFNYTLTDTLEFLDPNFKNDSLLFIPNKFVDTILNSCGVYHLWDDLPTRDSIERHWSENLFIQKESKYTNYNVFQLGYCDGIYCTDDFELVFTNKNNEILLIIDGVHEDGYFDEYSIAETPGQYRLSSIGEREPNEHFPFRDSLILNVHFDSIQDSIVIQYYIRYGEISE